MTMISGAPLQFTLVDNPPDEIIFENNHRVKSALKYLEKKYNMKIHIQKKTDKLEKYIQNIKVSKIIL